MTAIDTTIDFTLLEFNPRRHIRGAPAARVQIKDDETSEDYWVWMTASDIRKNMKLYGEHPALLQALESYK